MKLTGFRASHRNRWQLVQSKILSLQEYLLLEYYLDIMDFDGNHEKFGTFEVFYDEIGEIFNRSVDSIRDWHKGLVEKGFVKVADEKRHLFLIPTPRRYVVSGKKKGMAYFYAQIEKTVHTNETLQATINFSQGNTENSPLNSNSLLKEDTSKALTSFKDKSRLPSVPSNDTKGINSTEDKELSHQDIADTFFQGNLFDYLDHLEKGGGR